ncbi:hypothetical protein OJAV_G00134540 [Oryzias javanicus]|uniref:Uncharacterized protein n=1 Tax=Oryzias javanicus TaxID=123683 RepID=A0A437CRV5_ORYJA|nr:hypothetical protein OJAV_G00134540 [Oryzias javanicus]
MSPCGGRRLRTRGRAGTAHRENPAASLCCSLAEIPSTPMTSDLPVQQVCGHGPPPGARMNVFMKVSPLRSPPRRMIRIGSTWSPTHLTRRLTV